MGERLVRVELHVRLCDIIDKNRNHYYYLFCIVRVHCTYCAVWHCIRGTYQSLFASKRGPKTTGHFIRNLAGKGSDLHCKRFRNAH